MTKKEKKIVKQTIDKNLDYVKKKKDFQQKGRLKKRKTNDKGRLLTKI
jgi:hypothetical protein